jgi:hypothetical protein
LGEDFSARLADTTRANGAIKQKMVERSLFRAVVTQSYLLILQGKTRNSCLFSSLTSWSQNGAKQVSTNLPAEICLKSTRLRVASAVSARTSVALDESDTPVVRTPGPMVLADLSDGTHRDASH